jgi:hypothetical protein
MSGKHRLHRSRERWTVKGRPARGFYVPGDNPKRRIWITVGVTVVAVGGVGVAAASGFTVPPAQAQPAQAQIRPLPTAPLRVMTAPRDADDQHDLLTTQANEAFLSALASDGISTAGREEKLLMMAHQGADSHTTDADLKQSIRALFPDIDDHHGDSFVFVVRKFFPSQHDDDTDGDGR